MDEMWKRIKKWVIKKLGGYTKAEVDAMTHISRIEFVPEPTTKNIVMIRAECEVVAFSRPPEEWVEDKLANELARQMKPYVTYEAYFNDFKLTTIMAASIEVVCDNG